MGSIGVFRGHDGDESFSEGGVELFEVSERCIGVGGWVWAWIQLGKNKKNRIRTHSVMNQRGLIVSRKHSGHVHSRHRHR